MSPRAGAPADTETQPSETQRPDSASASPVPRAPILSDSEVAERMLLLSELQAALAAHGVHCVLARNHRLVLLYNRSPCPPSGLTDPELYIFTADGTEVATTDGHTYSLASGAHCPASDPGAAAEIILRRRQNAQQA
jgi:hypothetical protein